MLRRWPTYALILLSALSVGAAVARAPVFQGASYPEGLRLADAASVMFDRSDYALTRSWRAAADGDGEAARDWARRSAAHAPGSAYVALALAWGETLAGDEQAGRAALERSYQLAPRSMPLAVSRVSLAQRWWPDFDEERRRRLLEEIRIARGLDAHGFNLLAAETPRLKSLYALSDPLR